jgi:hypothetical protein
LQKKCSALQKATPGYQVAHTALGLIRKLEARATLAQTDEIEDGNETGIGAK